MLCFADSVVMEARASHKEGIRILVATLLLVAAARAFLTPAVQLQHPPRRPCTSRRAEALVSQGASSSPSGAGGLSATLPIDAMTRAEALNGFFAALVLSTAVVPAPASRLGVVDDLLADCPSVRESGRRGMHLLVATLPVVCLLAKAWESERQDRYLQRLARN